MRKQGILVLMTLIMLLMTGCWSRTEINDIAVVTAMAMDEVNDGEIRLALQLALPRLLGPTAIGGGGTEMEAKATWVVAEKGKNLMDALEKIQSKLPRRLFFSHNRVLVIGEKLARKGVAPLLDSVSRGRQSRLDSYILFTKGEAMQIINFTPKFERVGAEIIREEEKQGVMVNKTVGEFLNILLDEGIQPLASRIEVIPSIVPNAHNSQDKKQHRNLGTVGVAVFRKDKLAGWLNHQEGRGLLWLRNELKTSLITINIPKEKGSGHISIRVLKSTTKRKPTLQNGKIYMKVQIRSSGEVIENTSKLDLNDPKIISYIQHELENELKKSVQLTLNKVQKQFKSDIIGFGNSVFREYPTYWKDTLKARWDQEFPNVKVSIIPCVNVNQTGLNTKPFIWSEQEFIQ